MPLVANSLTHRWWVVNDLPVLVAIENMCYGMAWIEDDFRALFNKANNCCRIAEVNGKPVGYIIYSVEDTNKDNRRILLMSLAVLPSYRRKGVGSLLLQHVKNRIGKGRTVAIDTHVSEWNEPAQRFLHKHAFLATKVLRQFFDDHDDAYFFSYWLVEGECDGK